MGSHGKRGAVAGVNSHSELSADDDFSLDNIYSHLGPKTCPALCDKPKIILIQACRGGGAPLSRHRHNTAACNFKNEPLVFQTKVEASLSLIT